MCHCLWLCIESYHIATNPLSSLRKLQLAAWEYRLGLGEGQFLLRLQHDSPAATRPTATSIILSFLPKCQGTFWVVFGWGIVIKPLMMIQIIWLFCYSCQVGFVHWCTAKKDPSCPAAAQSITTPNALHSTSLALLVPWCSLSGCAGGVNTAVCLADWLLQSKNSEMQARVKGFCSLSLMARP